MKYAWKSLDFHLILRYLNLIQTFTVFTFYGKKFLNLKKKMIKKFSVSYKEGRRVLDKPAKWAKKKGENRFSYFHHI